MRLLVRGQTFAPFLITVRTVSSRTLSGVLSEAFCIRDVGICFSLDIPNSDQNI
jgi:hypothetical protein